MNGSEAVNQELVDGIVAGASSVGQVELLVCPPYPYIASVRARLGSSGVKLGAQSVSEHESGAFTGEIAGPMLRDVGCDYALLLGHSERRALMGETSSIRSLT